jgi:sporulation protein YqfC
MAFRARRARATFPALEWLSDATGLQYRITLLGNTRALVENHAGILEFTDAVIRLKARGGTVAFEGAELLLSEVRPGALSIRGAIERIVFLTGKGPKDA